MTMRSGFLTGLLPLLLGGLDSAVADDPTVVFDFSCVRAYVPTTTDEDILDLAEYMRRHPRALEADGSEGFLTHWDGVMWGSSHRDAAAQWVSGQPLLSSAERRSLESLPWFPSETRVMGLGPDFGWQGFGNRVIDVRSIEDESTPMFWVDLRMLSWMFLFSVDPELAFDEYAIRGREGTVTLGLSVLQNGAIQVHRRFVERGSTFVHELWTEHQYDALEPPHRFVYAIKNQSEGGALIMDLVVRSGSTVARTLPRIMSEIRQAHADVEGVGEVMLRTSYEPPIRAEIASTAPAQTPATWTVVIIIFAVAMVVAPWMKQLVKRKTVMKIPLSLRIVMFSLLTVVGLQWSHVYANHCFQLQSAMCGQSESHGTITCRDAEGQVCLTYPRTIVTPTQKWNCLPGQAIGDDGCNGCADTVHAWAQDYRCEDCTQVPDGDPYRWLSCCSAATTGFSCQD